MHHTCLIVFTWLHILAAAAWTGGMMFLILALVPALRTLPDRATALALIRATGHRFKILGWVSLGILILTGFGNLWARGLFPALHSCDFWLVGYGKILGIKLALVGITLGISGLHDFLVGPRAVEVMRRNPDAPATKKLRLLASWMGRTNFLLALAIILCGVLLVRGV